MSAPCPRCRAALALALAQAEMALLRSARVPQSVRNQARIVAAARRAVRVSGRCACAPSLF